MKTAFDIWKSGPRHEDYEVWREAVIPRIMEENSRLTDAAQNAISALSAAWTDIAHWLELAEKIREDLDDPDHEPNTPSKIGIENSRQVKVMLGNAMRELRDAIKPTV